MCIVIVDDWHGSVFLSAEILIGDQCFLPSIIITTPIPPASPIHTSSNVHCLQN